MTPTLTPPPAVFTDQPGFSSTAQTQFVAHFIRFVSRGCRAQDYPTWFAHRLIAIFAPLHTQTSKVEFYILYFSTPAGRATFFDLVRTYPTTHSFHTSATPVVRTLQDWLATYLFRISYPPSSDSKCRSITKYRTDS